MSTFVYDRKKKSYDGTTVADVLDVYVPEWRNARRRSSTCVASGTTSSGRKFAVWITVDRSHLVRLETSGDVFSSLAMRVPVTAPKHDVLLLVLPSDKPDGSVDMRFMLLVQDMSNIPSKEERSVVK